MQQRRKIAAIIAAIMVVGSTGVSAEKETGAITNPYYEFAAEVDYFEANPFLSNSIWIDFFASTKKEKELGPVRNSMTISEELQKMVLESIPVTTSSVTEQIDESTGKMVQEVIEEPEPTPEPRYGVDFTRIREKYPNKPFVKNVLTDEMQEYLNKKEAETGIPGAAIVAHAIWEVGWKLSTPKAGGKDSMNLFNIKNCNGNYVVMAGAKWQCYSSYIESVDGYIELITTKPRYAKAYEHIKNGGDIATYYRMLGDAGYYEANKNTYVNNCMSIINANKLLAK